MPPYTPDGFQGFAWDLEIIYPKGAHLLILTEQNWTFAPIYRRSIALENKYILGGNGAPK